MTEGRKVPAALRRQMAKVQRDLEALMAPDCEGEGTPEWWAKVDNLMREAQRLGLRASPGDQV